jgi:hypothetical protein
MKETPRSLRIYFGICAALLLFSALSLLAMLSIVGILLGLLYLGSAALLGYIAARLPQMLVTSTKPVIIALGLGVGSSLVGAVISLVAGAGIVGTLLQVVFTVAISAYLYKSVERLSAEARGGVMPAPQMAPQPGYGAPQLQPPAPPPHAPPSYAQLQPQQPMYAQPPQQQHNQQAYGAPPMQQPLGPGMQVIVNSPDGRRIPAVILQAQNGQFLCDSQGGQGWVPAHLVTRM